MRNWPVGQCRVCLGWGEKPQYADCAACSSWRQRYPSQAPCRRCGHNGHVNTDGLCWLCLLTIRLDDPEWIADPTGGRPSQLMLILPGDRLPRSQPLDKPQDGRAPDRSRPRSWLDQLRIASAEPVDDPRICPPAIRSQLLLIRPHRQLTETHARRIKHRNLADLDCLSETAAVLATERGLSKAWWRTTCLMLRLALAVREADGDDEIAEEALDDLPTFRNPVADVLRHAGLTGAGCSAPAIIPGRSSRPSPCAAASTATAGAFAASAQDARPGSSPQPSTRSGPAYDAGVRRFRCSTATAEPAGCTLTPTAPRPEHSRGPSCGSAETWLLGWPFEPALSATSPRTRRPEREPRHVGRRHPRSHHT